ncbi:MAG: tetratricopeptide repeat protein [Chitinophagaceae bacterium]|nr:tetratricopeptide repeat protein [Chitinophagaceae bacterium]
MIGKKNIFIALILLLAFVGITIFKYTGHSNDSSSSTDLVKPDSIQKFWAYYNSATDFRLQGKVDSAIKNYQEALNINQKHEDALYYIGNMFMNLDNYKQAQSSWEKLVEINPQSERAYIQLGNLYFCINHTDYFHPEKSKSYFERAASLNKETLSPNLKLGEIALFQNKSKEAFSIFNKLSMMDQKNAEIFFIIGYLNWKSGNEQGAIKGLEHTFELGIVTNSTNEQGDKAVSVKNESMNKKKECDIIKNWLTSNLIIPEKYDIRKEMPKAYKEFDQYLIMIRKQLNRN